jgi:S-adenosylmethionine:tRNA ribosyltransferase-isomerase
MNTSDFYYDLPKELIAQTPLEKRDGSQAYASGQDVREKWSIGIFTSCRSFCAREDCLVFNDSRVLPARLIGTRPTGGSVEVLLLRDLGGGRWECLTKPGRKTRPGTEITFGNGELTAAVEEVTDGGNRIILFHYDGIFLEILEKLGRMPLPPYIKEELKDPERYQTVYSRELGSAAAPTAGLHFTKELLDEIASRGVKVCYLTLHVGLGTFRPVKEDNIEEHEMHSEFCIVPEDTARIVTETKKNGGASYQWAQHPAVRWRALQSPTVHWNSLRDGRTSIFIPAINSNASTRLLQTFIFRNPRLSCWCRHWRAGKTFSMPTRSQLRKNTGFSLSATPCLSNNR